MTSPYREFAADPAVAAHVHCVWEYEATEEGVEQPVPPDGRCELIVHLGQAYEELGADGAWHRQPDTLLAGQLTRPLVLRARGHVNVLAARFKPAGAWAFAGVPLSSCTDRRIGLSTLHCNATERRLRAELAGAATAQARRSILSAYVLRQLVAREERRDDKVELCVEHMLASEGRLSLEALSELSQLGERQLQRRFAEVVGISPRTFGVVLRLRRVFDALRDAPMASWSERAQVAGFFDHPQMARDFRRLMGRAPSQWAAAGRGLAASLVDSRA